MIHRILSLTWAALLLVVFLPLLVAATPSPSELLSSGRADDAIAALRSQLRSSPNDAEAYALMMRTYLAMERWDDAIAAGQRATALAPNNSRYHWWLGRAYGEKANQSAWVAALPLARKVRAELEKAVELDGSDIEARVGLAEFYIEAPSFLGGGKEKAQAQAEQLHALGNEANALLIRAEIAEAHKDYDLAERHLHASTAAGHGSPETLLGLASFYQRRSRFNDMETAVNQAAQAALHQRPSLLLEAAEMLCGANRNFNSALAMVHDYIAAPQHSEDAPVFRAYYLLGILLEKAGDKRAAAAQYRAALSLASGFESAQMALRRVE
jgi:tetratricopeptide (TPR) repeat protein